jgi:hypothetical protein
MSQQFCQKGGCLSANVCVMYIFLQKDTASPAKTICCPFYMETLTNAWVYTGYLVIKSLGGIQGFGSGSVSGSAWIRINLSCWIRIRIQIADPDPDPGGQK